METFFLCNAISYPFLDKSEFLRDMDEAYRNASGRRSLSGVEEERVRQGKDFVLFMVIAIGTTNRERMGDVERGASRVFRDRAMGGLSAAIGNEDIVSA